VYALTPSPSCQAAITASGPTSFCAGGSVVLTATEGQSYLWSPGGETTRSITITSSGNYSVIVTSASGCSATTPVTSVTVYDSPSVNAGNDQTVYYGYGPMACATLTASVSGGSGSYTYLWSNGATGESITVCPGTTTNYTVTVTGEHGCSSSDQVTVNVIDVRCGNNNQKVTVCHSGNGLCIDSSAVAAHLAIGDALGPCGSGKRSTGNDAASQQLILLQSHPNPFGSTTTIEYMLEAAGVVRLEVFNSAGERVRALGGGYRGAGRHTAIWDGSDDNGMTVGSGRYIVRIVIGELMQQQQVILQK
jgi:hypothetical protein